MEQWLGIVAMALPIGIQWARASKKFPEELAVALIIVAGIAGYWLFTPGAHDVTSREFWQGCAIWIGIALGLNRVTSSVGHIAPQIVPETNSKP